VSRSPLPFPIQLALCCSLAGWLTAGCSPAEKPAATATKPAAAAAGHDDHDHDEHGHDEAHGHAETLAEGVAELGELTREIAEKLAGDAHDAADGAVHAAGHLLEELKEKVAAEELTDDAKEAATKALDELYECFDKLDVALHSTAKEGAETVAEVHASIAERVKAAVESLEARFSKEDK
jgi:ElaB/YqjD/DUF883 family membrane-anchored ribosome-binding protein